MEYASDDDTSDKDKKMKGSFESFSGDDKDKKKDTKRKPPALFSGIIETGTKETPEKPKERDEAKKSSLFEMLQAATKELIEKDNDDTENEPDELDDGLETEGAHEEVARVETVTDDEQSEIVKSYVSAVIPEVAQEINDAEPESVEAAEASANLDFLLDLQDRTKGQDVLDEESIKSIADQVINNIEEEVPRDTESTNEIISTKDSEEIPELPVPEVSIDEQVEATTEDNSDSSVSTTSEIPPNIPTIGEGNPDVSSDHGNHREEAILPSVDTKSEQDSDDAEFQLKRRRAGDLLLGGIVGYMIGRRRGRINTENKLKPIQEKLEKQVSSLQDTIATKELEIRKAAKTRFEVNKQPRIKNEEVPEKVEEVRDFRPEKKEVGHGHKTEENEHSKEPDTGKKRNTEQLERNEEKRVGTKTVEIMSLPLLLEMAAEIRLENISLKSIYDEGIIDQKQLRKLVKRYIDGEQLHRIWPDTVRTNQTDPETITEIGMEQKLSDTPQLSNKRDGPMYGPSELSNPLINLAEPGHFTNQHNQQAYDYSSTTEGYKTNRKTVKASNILIVFIAIIVGIILIAIFT
ncbi:hypothetical protein KDA00_04735 [Candidatus Saccharibacteria bacterium]|nr:hypothetical protein [Candidatus Saccharibacteria bacterium]